MKKISIISFVENGTLKRNRNLIKSAIDVFEGKEVVFTIEKKSKKRSLNQNAYLWGCLYPIAQNAIKNEWGEVWGVEKTHEFFKSMFLFREIINQKTGEIVKIPKSTTENTTEEQEIYHSEIRDFLKYWFNVLAPLPNEDLKLEI